ncbi:MAG: hypothetical protein IIA87_00190 [Nanoarchaeota archaeon]|nr:hypothetical protein [Nanoarchaeota archaeon]
MKAEWLFFIGFGILMFSIFISLAIIFLAAAKLGPSQSTLESCKTLIYNGKDNINLLFFSDKETASIYTDFFLKAKPFAENKEKFNFFYIDDYEPECEFYKQIALLCYSKKNVQKAASCPNDYVVIVKSVQREIRSSAYLNFITLNKEQPKTVFLHEFGHVSANLAEEYLTNQNPPRGSKNCVTDCQNFGGLQEGCFQECSQGGYLRSIENGVMRTLSSNEYGTFNENLILKEIEKIRRPQITGFAVDDTEENQFDCSQEKYYLIEGVYKSNDEIEIIGKTLEIGCSGGNDVGPFSYNIVLEDDSITQGEKFNPQPIFTDIQGEEETEINGEIYTNEEEFFLTIPEIRTAETLQIFNDKDKQITQTSLNDIGARPCRK